MHMIQAMNFLCKQGGTGQLIKQPVKPVQKLIFQKERAGQTSPAMSPGGHMSHLQFSPHLQDLNTLEQIHHGGQ